MTLREAQALCELIGLDLPQDAFLLKQMHPDEWVVLIKGERRVDTFYCWCKDDWTRYRHRISNKRWRAKQHAQEAEETNV